MFQSQMDKNESWNSIQFTVKIYLFYRIKQSPIDVIIVEKNCILSIKLSQSAKPNVILSSSYEYNNKNYLSFAVLYYCSYICALNARLKSLWLIAQFK